MNVETKGLPGRDSGTGGYLVSSTLNHGMKKIDPIKMTRSEIKIANYYQNCYFCSGTFLNHAPIADHKAAQMVLAIG